jgi:hypothetical protein
MLQNSPPKILQSHNPDNLQYLKNCRNNSVCVVYYPSNSVVYYFCNFIIYYLNNSVFIISITVVYLNNSVVYYLNNCTLLSQ